MSKEALLGRKEVATFASGHEDKGYDMSMRDARKKLLIATSICFIFMVVEIVGGAIAGSLALFTDALHLLSDLASNLISLFALWLLTKRGTEALSFGYHRAEILGALLSVFLVWAITVWLFWEAIIRLVHPKPVDGRIMTLTAAIGLSANILISCVLGSHTHAIGGVGGTCNHGHHHPASGHSERATPLIPHPCHVSHDAAPHSSSTGGSDGGSHGECQNGRALAHRHGHHHHHEHGSTGQSANHGASACAHEGSGSNRMNMRAAYIHAISDVIQCAGVLLAGIIIWWKPTWLFVDPICTFLFSLLVLWTTISVIIEATQVLMEGSPAGVDCAELLRELSEITGVSEIHDLHVWSLTVGTPALAVHIVACEEGLARQILEKATFICQEKHHILHTTIQIDFGMNAEQCGTKAHRKCHSKRRPPKPDESAAEATV